MRVLTVDTSTTYVVTGVVEIPGEPASPTPTPPRSNRAGDLTVLAERIVDNPRGHMELLTPNILECLEEASLTPADLDAVVVGTGPGPFTGLRVGLATAHAFADALGIPIHGISSHAAIAAATWDRAASEQPSTKVDASELMVITDARRREWYYSFHQRQAGTSGFSRTTRVVTTAPPLVGRPEDAARALERRRRRWKIFTSSVAIAASRGIAAGVPEHLGQSLTIVSDDAIPTPRGLARAIIDYYGSPAPLLRHVPAPRSLYLRRPDALEPKRHARSEAVVLGDLHTPAEDRRRDVPTLTTLSYDDAPACATLEQRLFADESPWSQKMFEQVVEEPRCTYLGLVDLVEGADQLVGYAGIVRNGSDDDPEWEIHTVALAPERQGLGWSHYLLRPLLEEADRFGGDVFLEVRTDNTAAIALYEKYGFEIVGLRRRYYKPSQADAYTMRRPSALITAESPQVDATAVADSDASSVRGYLVMGIETSCDETGVGVVELPAAEERTETGKITPILIANEVASSVEQHARFGGVVPEVASRAHLEAMIPTMQRARQELARRHPGVTRPDAVAATIGPGLAGALLVGAAAAKAYAAAWGVPFYAVNHLGGHVAVEALTQESVPISAPAMDNAIALLVSGGHTQLLHVRGLGKPMIELGSTLDDAAGEAYDKVSRLLGLGYPGGPIIDTLAAQGNSAAIALPRAMMRQQDAAYDFSFSGLKTAVARYVEKLEATGQSIPIEDLCASFQEAVVDVLTKKALRACADTGATTLLLGGGVSANRRLRELARERCAAAGVTLLVPPAQLCTDNGAMIAALAAQVIAAGAQPSPLSVATDPALDVAIPVVQ